MIHVLLSAALVLAALPHVQATRNLSVFVIDWSSIDGTDPVQIWDGVFTQGVDSAFFIAMHHFNERNTTIIPDLARLADCPVNITIAQFCDTGGNLRWAAHDVLYAFNEFQIDAIAGFGGIQDVQSGEPIAEYFNGVPSMCHWVSDPLASDKNLFPSFARTIPQDYTHADRLTELLQQFQAKEAALLYLSDGAVFAQYFAQQMASLNFSLNSIEFQYDVGNDNIDDSVKVISQMDLNIIVCATWALQLTEIADAAAKYGLLDDKYLWIFTYLDRNPTNDEFAASANLRRLMNGSLRVGIVVDSPNWKAYLENFPSYAMYQDDINSKLPPHGANNSLSCKDSKFMYQLAPGYFADPAVPLRGNEVWGFAYDSIMALGFATCDAYKANGNVFPNGSAIYQAILSTSFVGLSGTSVEFDNVTGDRDPTTAGFAITNWQLLDNDTVVQSVAGHFDPAASTFTLYSTIVFRQGVGLGALPSYVVIPSQEMNYLPLWAKVIGYIELGFAQVLSLVCFGFTAVFRRDPVFVNGQPVLLMFIVIGCSLAAWAILGLATDDITSQVAASTACMVAPVMFNFGLTITLSSLAAKMWRIWKIFENKKMRHVRVRVGRVVLFVTTLSSVVLVLMIAWIAAAPLSWERVVDSVDTNGYPLSSHGQCAGNTVSYVFLGLVFGITFIVLLVASYLAYHVRSFPAEYQESSYVGMLVMSLLQIYVVALPSVIAVYSVAIGRFLLLASVVFVTVVVIQLVMFVPKIYLVVTKKELWPKPNHSLSGAFDYFKPRSMRVNIAGNSPRPSPDTAMTVKLTHHEDDGTERRQSPTSLGLAETTAVDLKA